MELFKTYEHVLFEDCLMDNFRNIVNKANNLANPELKSCIEESEEKLVKFHIEKKEQEWLPQKCPNSSEKLRSLENCVVASNGEETAESNIVEDEKDVEV